MGKYKLCKKYNVSCDSVDSKKYCGSCEPSQGVSFRSSEIRDYDIEMRLKAARTDPDFYRVTLPTYKPQG